MTRVAILWHMHQPFYQDLLTGEHILPWVRLHALKDYYGMVALLKEFPDVKVTFNLVPSLLVQLEAFARDDARDPHLEVGLKPADALSEDERAFCIEQFFHAHRSRMVDPYPRYAELLAQRGGGAGLSARSQVSHFSVDDLRDLQVWHKLAWLDPFYLEGDERVLALVRKGHGFSEEDKRTLRGIELELLGKVIPEYREAAERGQVELSTSPFYHPILPLLCDTDVYLNSHPQSRMPRERFQRPDDAVEQLTRAASLHERLFGRRPQGLWPSEGSVSDEVVPLVAAAGFQWMATDEEILARTLSHPFTRDGEGNVEQPDRLYRPYSLGPAGQPVSIVFRDHVLSDLIGFTYASWSAEFAADDFVRRLEAAGGRYTARTGREATISIILDGENAWEHYEGGGRPFLRALYARLGRHRELRTVTMGEACREPDERLSGIFPGSWINGDFYIWIGHEDDRRAWNQLADARRAYDMAPESLTETARAQAREELLIAEGSDWCWWYGDDHSSEHDLAFDDLFRRHVRNVYRALERPIPEELFVTNITTSPPAPPIGEPTGLIHPVIDGEITSYFEWVGSGCLEIGDVAGAMHQTSGHGNGVSAIEYGFDLEHLYLRVEGGLAAADLMAADVTIGVEFFRPAGLEVSICLRDGLAIAELHDRRVEASERPSATCRGLQAAVGSVVELQVPFRCLKADPSGTVAFMVVLRQGGREAERYPRYRPVEVTVPGTGFSSEHWSA